MSARFNPPPSWPAPPAGWTPGPEWRPDPAWPAPPPGWQLWVDEHSSQPEPVAHRIEAPAKIGLFGVRKHARSLAEQVEQLRAALDRLGALDVAELTRQREELTTDVAALADRHAAELGRHQQRLAEETDRAGKSQQRKVLDLEVRLTELSQQVVVTKEQAILQEAGLYTYRHPLSDAVAYQAELGRIQNAAKAMTQRDGGAVSATSTWQVNGSAAQGRAMVRDLLRFEELAEAVEFRQSQHA